MIEKEMSVQQPVLPSPSSLCPFFDLSLALNRLQPASPPSCPSCPSWLSCLCHPLPPLLSLLSFPFWIYPSSPLCDPNSRACPGGLHGNSNGSLPPPPGLLSLCPVPSLSFLVPAKFDAMPCSCSALVCQPLMSRMSLDSVFMA